MSKITYHKSHKFVDLNGTENIFITQLYKIGVYGILNNDPAAQGNFTPTRVKKMEKDLKKALENKLIESYELGVPITVTDESGMWEEVTDE